MERPSIIYKVSCQKSRQLHKRALTNQNTNNEVQIEAASFYEDNGT